MRLVAKSRGSLLIRLMGVTSGDRPQRSVFDAFVREVEPQLLQALVSTYGPNDGRDATKDALSWAWEHWDQLDDVTNKIGYLYRVGQSATRKFRVRHLHDTAQRVGSSRIPDFDPALIPALHSLSDQQRTVVVLVHGFQWTQSEVARLLGVGPSTVREHLHRALDRLRAHLEVSDVC